jgi:hypothetical protein
VGKVKALWQEERDRRWQQHFDDYCADNNLGNPSGRAFNDAEQYADDMMEEEDSHDAS